MKKRLLTTLITSIIIINANLTFGNAAADLTSLWQPIVRGDLSNDSVYFVMTDRYANGDTGNDQALIGGGRLGSGYDPTDIGWYHGGDFQGLTAHLDRVKELGFTSIWITPPVVQQYIQGMSAAYHGYWGVDFTTIDPHLGTEADFKAFVARAHELEMKVIVDIVVNHTANVIKYKLGMYTYLEPVDYPYKNAKGKPFDSTKYAGKSTFPKLSATKSFAREPFLPKAYAKIKKPAWLNNPTNYHNRGDSTFTGTSTLDGDFVGLDDLFTEKPEVVKGWTDLWSSWITKFNIDGYRIDTAKHVNPEFWQAFLPKILAAAKAAGKSEFPIFGETYETDPNSLATFVTQQKFPAVLDFAFQKNVILFARSGYQPANMADIFNADDLFTTTKGSAYGLATFLGNHDMGRTGMFLENATFGDTDLLLARSKMANALLFLLRGGPVLYYGDEKGMTGTGGDQLARQDMFATQVNDWKNETRIGNTPIGDRSAFDVRNPLEEQIAEIQKVTKENPALRSGTQQTRYAGQSTFIVTRYLDNQEYLVVFNSREENVSASSKVATLGVQWLPILGTVESVSQVKDGELSITMAPLSYTVLKADRKFTPTQALSIKLNAPKIDYSTENWFALSANVPGNDYVEVTFAIREKSKNWRVLGTSDHRTFASDSVVGGLHRVYLHPREFKSGRTLEIVAIVKDASGAKVTSNIRTLSIRY